MPERVQCPSNVTPRGTYRVQLDVATRFHAAARGPRFPDIETLDPTRSPLAPRLHALHLLAGKTPPDKWHTRRETEPQRHGSGTAPDGRTAEGGTLAPREASGLPRTEATHAFRNGFECSPRAPSSPWWSGHRSAAPCHADDRAIRAAAVHFGVSTRGLRVQDDRGKSPLHSYTRLSIGLGGGGA